MRRSRRRLDVGPDGRADVVVLGDPIPRHVSIVSYGANDRVAQSWMSAVPGSADAIGRLRAPPTGPVVSQCKVSAESIAGYIDETLSAWRDVIVSIMDAALEPEARVAQIISATSQAAARVAALAHAVGPEASAAALRGFTIDSGLTRTVPTFDSQVERVRVLQAVDAVIPVMKSAVLELMRSGTPQTESILSVFSDVGHELAEWMSEVKGGPVGVPGSGQASASEMSGARHSKADKERLQKIIDILGELLPADPPAPEQQPESGSAASEKVMTIEQLKALAVGDPLGFLGVIDDAIKAAQQKSPAEAKKYAWGETGVAPHSPDDILNQLRAFASGDQLLTSIAGAVAGVDIEGQGQTASSPQVASAMKQAFGRVVAAEIRSNPQGALASAVRELIAPSVASAITATLKSYLDGGERQGNPAGMVDFGSDSNMSDDDLQAALAPRMPTMAKPARAAR